MINTNDLYHLKKRLEVHKISSDSLGEDDKNQTEDLLKKIRIRVKMFSRFIENYCIQI